jgi:hypothetical protein
MGVGSKELFGLYKLDATFSSVTHADFAARATGMGSPLPKEIYYSTGDPNGDLAITGATCSNGVWTIPTPGGDIFATLTASGLFMLNKSDDGGILSFKVANAATLADLSGKTIQGIQFPDDDVPSPISVTFGAPTADDITGNVKIGAISGTTLSVAETGTATIKKASAQNDAGLNLTVAPADGGSAYATNSYFDTLYPTIGDIPGLFYIPPQGTDNGSVFLMVGKLNGKILAFGGVFNDRDIDPDLPNTGAFIAFEP